MDRASGSHADIPPEVRRFLDRCIDGVESLDILLLLYQHQARSWDAAAVADALQMPRHRASTHLEALGGCNLLDIHIGAEMRYRFEPANEALRTGVRDLVSLYRTHRAAVIGYVAGRRFRALRDFSDAFRIKDSTDG